MTLTAAPRAVAVTGLGAVSVFGEGCDALWSGVAAGRSGIATIRRFSTDGFSVHTGAIVPRANDEEPSREFTERLCREFIVSAAREAFVNGGLDPLPHGMTLALVVGTGITELLHPLNEIVESIADELCVNGARLTVSTACSSSTAALGLGRDLLAMNSADVVLAGGVDVLTPEVFAGFHALGVLSPTRCAPFSTPSGTTLGEGAGFLVLERIADARARHARVRSTLAGYGLSGDAWHETSPDPKGFGIERVIRSALADAGVRADSIGYVNAHGSGTQANDSAEWLGISRALGPSGSETPVSSTKGAIGHTQGAAGVLEAIVTIEAMERGVVPPTANFVGARPHAPPDPVGESSPRPSVFRHAVSVNSAFGGANAAIVLSRDGDDVRSPHRRPVAIRGLGLVGSFGLGNENFVNGRGDGRVPDFSIERLVRDADPRGMDPASRYLTAAAALALTDAGVVVRGALRDRIGLLVGQRRTSSASLTAFHDSIEARGLTQLSASAFARIVLNAAAGACSKLLSLRGPLSVVTTGTGAGLTAIALAAEVVSTRDDVDLMIAGGVDERLAAGTGDDRADGAACALLGVADEASAICLAGWGLAGPGDVVSAIERAAPNGIPEGALVFRVDDSDAGASGAAFLLADAVLALRSGAARAAIVTNDRGRSLSSALLITC